MRIARYMILGLMATALTFSAAHAADSKAASSQAHIFGTAPCGSHFSCSTTDSNTIAQMANNCSVGGFGLDKQLTGLFDSSSTDSDNCMSAELPNTGGTSSHTMESHCCITAQGDNCSMVCQLLTN